MGTTHRVIEAGLKIGRLTLVRVSRVGVVKSLNVWECTCACGKTTQLRQGDLARSNCKRSCGCLAKEAHAKFSKRAFHS